MRHRVHTFKIGRTGAHRRAMLANMACSLFSCGEIKTTVSKAKEARRFVDKMITMGKKGDLHHRRLAASRLRNKDAVKLLFGEIAPKYLKRNGGYTRIIRLGERFGDKAEICILQLVEEELPEQKKSKGKDKASAKEQPVTEKEEQKQEEIKEKDDSKEEKGKEEEKKDVKDEQKAEVKAENEKPKEDEKKAEEEPEKDEKK